MLEAIDFVSFRRAMRKNDMHANFDYKAGHHTIPPHYDTIVDNILNQHLSTIYTDRPSPAKTLPEKSAGVYEL